MKRAARARSSAMAIACLAFGAFGCGTSTSESASDASALEASTDGASDATDAGEASVSCSPGDVSSFTPSWHPPGGAHQGKCTAAQIDAFYIDCLSSAATNASCAAFGKDAGASDRACASCLVSRASDATLGPVVVYSLVAGTAVALDFAGCIALADPSALDCAKRYQAAVECEHAACDAVCRSDDAASFDQYSACLNAANLGVCDAYEKAGRCVFDLGDGGADANAGDGGDAVSRCLFAGQSFEELYRAIAPLFCGP